MIVDANLLLYFVDQDAAHHGLARQWLTDALTGERRIGFPWQSLGAFARIATHPRLFRRPLSTAEVDAYIQAWLAHHTAWVPPTTERTVRAYSSIATRHHVTGNLVPDAQLAALALEFGVPVVSFDSDFARFSEITWINPLTAS